MMLGQSNTLSPAFQPLAMKGLHRGDFKNGPIAQADPLSATLNGVKPSKAVAVSAFQEIQAECLSGLNVGTEKKAAGLESLKPFRR